ncbi:hypothetical protein SO802_003506 [Lithocarpus litseifolius]|uniref:RNase H type-1 domain-containing protein n=1 Tax=Lithocarpus litseifolius TaxID=425828 RepID=A0AAW2E0V3_9ROSI
MKYLEGGSDGAPEQRQQPSSEQGGGRSELDWAPAGERSGTRSADLALGHWRSSDSMSDDERARMSLNKHNDFYLSVAALYLAWMDENGSRSATTMESDENSVEVESLNVRMPLKHIMGCFGQGAPGSHLTPLANITNVSNTDPTLTPTTKKWKRVECANEPTVTAFSEPLGDRRPSLDLMDLCGTKKQRVENLKLWNHTTFGHVRNTLAKKLRELQNAEETDCYRTNLGRIYVLRDEIQKLKTREELMWKQRSRNMWLKEGDRNTRYFHCRENQRNRRNFILELEDETDLPPNATVNSLINHDIGEWKSEIVQANFLPHEAATILSIPLSERTPPDRITWSLTPSGQFSTSSAYKMLVACVSNECAGSSNPTPTRKFWRGIWQLRVPCHNALPTMSNLRRCQITNSAMCAMCKNHEEDKLHAIWSCGEIACVWNSFTWFHQAVTSPPSDFTDLLSRFLQVQDEFNAKIFSITAWLLWNWRNAQHFGRPMHPLGHLCSMAGDLLQEYLAAQELEPITSIPPVMQQWQPPALELVKLNFDAAVFSPLNLAGIGVIARDWNGAVLGALSMPISLSQTVNEMEAIACRKAVQFAKELRLQKVVFQGDSLVVINALSQGPGCLSSYWNVIDNILVLADDFQLCEFSHVKRVCNVVADMLAKKAKDLLEVRVWLDDLPGNIYPLVLFDVH